MSSTAGVGGSQAQQAWTLTRKVSVGIPIAIGVIAAVAGSLALIAASGYNLGGLNALSVLTIGGGSGVLAAGVLSFAVAGALFWKFRNDASAESSRKRVNESRKQIQKAEKQARIDGIVRNRELNKFLLKTNQMIPYGPPNKDGSLNFIVRTKEGTFKTLNSANMAFDQFRGSNVVTPIHNNFLQTAASKVETSQMCSCITSQLGERVTIYAVLRTTEDQIPYIEYFGSSNAMSHYVLENKLRYVQ